MSAGSYPEGENGVIDLGLRHFVMASGDGYLWWHDCPVEHPAWGYIGDIGTRKSGHVIIWREPLTVRGSLLCSECGDHGHIEEGVWKPC